MISSKLARLISVAKGEKPADLVMGNAKVVNVFNGEVEVGDVAIYGGRIAGIGKYKRARESINLDGRYVAPGLINGHTHIESSMLDLDQYTRAVVSKGTLAVVTDMHELVNVCGRDAIRYAFNSVRHLPLDFFLMAPSCVPATHLETSGSCLDADEIKSILKRKEVLGLGEMMNYTGVISGNENVLNKVSMAEGKIIDGHAPMVKGHDLTAYIAAGIYSDHESVALGEANEKLKQGMYIMIREGSSEKNLQALLPLITDKTYKRCMFVVDDRSCDDLLHDGDMDAIVRKSITLGLEPVRAIQLATINAAEYFGLRRLGAVVPGYFANLIVFDELSEFIVDMTFYRGKLVAEEGKSLFKTGGYRGKKPTNTVKMKSFDVKALRLEAKKKTMPVIEIIPGQIITKKRVMKIKIIKGTIVPDIEEDIIKLVVVERHHASGNIGIGMVKGFKMKRGALVSSVAHDSHNIIAVGIDDMDIYTGIKEVERLQGGLVVVVDGNVLASLALPIGGLMSDQPMEIVAARLEKLRILATELSDQQLLSFDTLSFLALPVIPELRLTDLGLMDVKTFKLIN